MKIKQIHTLIFLFVSLLIYGGVLLDKTADLPIKLNNYRSKYWAGSYIGLTFSIPKKSSNVCLILSHSYGKTALTPLLSSTNALFTLPKFFTKKSGNVTWVLVVNNQQKLKGSFKILPQDNSPTVIENYLGPRTILAEPAHYTMMVCVPTDVYDNPLKEQTPVLIKHQFLTDIVTHNQKTENFIAWERIYSKTKAGKLIVSTECKYTNSKEIETEIQPNIATDYTFTSIQNHDFADGNQITKLQTSVIKDKYQNIVADGTIVNFKIISKNGFFLRTQAATINGIATAQILHPDHAETYTIKSYITGIAESSYVTIPFKPLINNFQFVFTNKNRSLFVGPLKSYMHQLVPDGIRVIVKIYHKEKLIENIEAHTVNGIAKFNFEKDLYPKNEYQFEISTLGITKKTSAIKYGNH